MTTYTNHPSTNRYLGYPKTRESSYTNGTSGTRDRKSSASSAQSYHSLRKMTNTVRASNKSAILAVGEELRQLLHEEDPPIIKDRRYHLKSYTGCFVGHEMVDWLLKKGEVESRREAVAMMQKLLDNGVIHHVCDDHLFKDEKLFYRFRKDDGSYQEPTDAAILAKGQRLYSRIRGDSSGLIQDRKYHLTTYKQAFIGREFVDWLISKGEAQTRQEAVDIGRQLLDAGVFSHVCDDHHFKDEFLFFRFKNDDKGKSPRLRARLGLIKGSSRRSNKEDDDTGSSHSSGENRASGASWDSSSEVAPGDDYIHMQGQQLQASQSSTHSSPRPSPQPSPHLNRPQVPSPQLARSQQSSQHPSDIETNGSVPNAAAAVTGGVCRPTIEELTDPNGSYVKRKIDVVSDPVGYGFVIRGSRPVYIHTIDPSGPAAGAGLEVGEYLFSVNGQNVLHASHTDAARIILMGPSTASLVTFVDKDRVIKS